MSDFVVAADRVLLASGRTIENGAVRVRDGFIAAVGRRAEVAGGAATEVVLRDAVLTPGLINAHTHLALGSLDHCRPQTSGFAPWVRDMALRARALGPTDLGRGLGSGSRICMKSGVTAVGDIVPLAALAAARLRPLAGVSYLELLGFDTSFADLALPELPATMGFAPHAPYSTSADLYRGASGRARAEGRRLAFHLGESEEELEFLASGTGPLRTLLEDLGRMPPGWLPPGMTPFAWVAALGELGPDVAVIHATFATAADREILAHSGATVVTCPRSNLALTGRTADVPALLARGIPVALGTDSLASAPTLSLLDEMRALRAAHPSLDPDTVFAIATRGGARALGIDAGEIAPGLRADLAAFPLAHGGESLAEDVLAATAALFVCIGGRVVLPAQG